MSMSILRCTYTSSDVGIGRCKLFWLDQLCTGFDKHRFRHHVPIVCLSCMPTVSREWIYTTDGPNPSTIRYVAQRKATRVIDGKLVKGRWWFEWLHIDTKPVVFDGEKITWHPLHPTWFQRGKEPWTLARQANKAAKKQAKAVYLDTVKQRPTWGRKR